MYISFLFYDLYVKRLIPKQSIRLLLKPVSGSK